MPATYGVAADAVSYTSAISGCERAGEWMAAVQLFRQMRDAGVNPTMLTYSKLLFVHAAAGQWEAAVGFIEAATADGLLHNPLTLNPNPNPSPDPDPDPNPNPTPTPTPTPTPNQVCCTTPSRSTGCSRRASTPAVRRRRRRRSRRSYPCCAPPRPPCQVRARVRLRVREP